MDGPKDAGEQRIVFRFFLKLHEFFVQTGKILVAFDEELANDVLILQLVSFPGRKTASGMQ